MPIDNPWNARSLKQQRSALNLGYFGDWIESICEGAHWHTAVTQYAHWSQAVTDLFVSLSKTCLFTALSFTILPVNSLCHALACSFFFNSGYLTRTIKRQGKDYIEMIKFTGYPTWKSLVIWVPPSDVFDCYRCFNSSSQIRRQMKRQSKLFTTFHHFSPLFTT